jgi:cell division protein FtsX
MLVAGRLLTAACKSRLSLTVRGVGFVCAALVFWNWWLVFQDAKDKANVQFGLACLNNHPFQKLSG